MTPKEEREAIKTDTIIGLRILLEHCKQHCNCLQCETIREKLGMNPDCGMDSFKLPEKLT